MKLTTLLKSLGILVAVTAVQAAYPALAAVPDTSARDAAAQAADTALNAGSGPDGNPAANGDFPFATTRPDTLTIRPFEFNPPDPRREVLPNGLVVYLLEDHELPTFSITAYTKVGSIYAPTTKAGLSGMTGVVMRTGGTESQTGDQIDQALEFVGASIETGIGLEYGTAGGGSLIKDSDLVLKLLADLLRHPGFRQEKIDLAKGQAVEGIRRQNDNPNQIASREFGRLIYGRNSPWASVPTLASIRGITRQDLLDFQHRFYHPNNTIIAVTGDFKSDDMLAKIRGAFGDWPKAEIDYPKLEPLKDVEKSQVYVVERNLPQTVVWMGHLGQRRHSPDKPAVDVLNEIFGIGGFSSRLMREVRSNRGLAYSVGGLVGVGADRGIFYASAQTKTDSATQAAQLMSQIIGDMTSKPVTEDEVKLARESILNSYVFRYESPSEIVNQRAQMELLGYPADYLKTYPARVRAVTPADVKAAAAKYLHPNQMVTLIVGNVKTVQPAVTTLGTVSPLQLDPVEDSAPKPVGGQPKTP